MSCLLSAALPEPVPLIPGDPIQLFAYSGPTTGATRGGIARVDVTAEGLPFAQMLRLETAALPETPTAATEYALRIRYRSTVAVKKDDSVLATFWIRCAEPEGGECSTRLNVELGRAPWTKSVSQAILSDGQWREQKVLFRMAADYAPGDYNIEFWMGAQVQAVELGGIRFDNYGQGLTAADFGVDVLYDGAAQDAPWREEAEARIEKYRKAGLEVAVVDASGAPVDGAEVRVSMRRHAFGFGTAVAADQLLQNSENGEKYRRFVLENFNMAVFENDLKWPGWEQNRQRALNGIRWCYENGMTRIRGHNLVWPSWQRMPADVQALASDPEALRERVLRHIDDIMTGTSGQLEEWDVINEPYTNTDLQKILGDEEMAAWFKRARAADPTPLLFINDYSILSNGGGDLAHRNHYFKTIKFLQGLEAGVDGIGMQGHFSSPTPPETMLRILDRFAALGLPIEITEYDFNTTDEALQAKFTEDLLITVFSHPSVRAFLMWGFWEGRHWLPNGAMIRRDWTSKEMYRVWRDLVFKKWWTEEKLAAEGGTAKVRGFLGEYEVTAEAGGKTATDRVTLTAEGARVVLKLE
ncbi:MAG: endo-1,4-beta-xylanase [Bryobacteraceae bacterium]|nr:endo-1,4-beta-xylanase [Bryobacteraceae bacterium]